MELALPFVSHDAPPEVSNSEIRITLYPDWYELYNMIFRQSGPLGI